MLQLPFCKVSFFIYIYKCSKSKMKIQINTIMSLFAISNIDFLFFSKRPFCKCNILVAWILTNCPCCTRLADLRGYASLVQTWWKSHMPQARSGRRALSLTPGGEKQLPRPGGRTFSSPPVSRTRAPPAKRLRLHCHLVSFCTSDTSQTSIHKAARLPMKPSSRHKTSARTLERTRMNNWVPLTSI